MKKTKTLFDQAIEIIEAGVHPYGLFANNLKSKQWRFFIRVIKSEDDEDKPYIISLYTRLLLARELWNDGQEKYWKQGLFK